VVVQAKRRLCGGGGVRTTPYLRLGRIK
jgi:hypothetical protein